MHQLLRLPKFEMGLEFMIKTIQRANENGCSRASAAVEGTNSNDSAALGALANTKRSELEPNDRPGWPESESPIMALAIPRFISIGSGADEARSNSEAVSGSLSENLNSEENENAASGVEAAAATAAEGRTLERKSALPLWPRGFLVASVSA